MGSIEKKKTEISALYTMLTRKNCVCSALEQRQFQIPFFTMVLIFHSLVLVPQEGECEIIINNPDFRFEGSR